MTPLSALFALFVLLAASAHAQPYPRIASSAHTRSPRDAVFLVRV
jgi:hypothetical protein